MKAEMLEMTVKNQDLMRRLNMQRQSKDMSNFAATSDSSHRDSNLSADVLNVPHGRGIRLQKEIHSSEKIYYQWYLFLKTQNH